MKWQGLFPAIFLCGFILRFIKAEMVFLRRHSACQRYLVVTVIHKMFTARLRVLPDRAGVIYQAGFTLVELAIVLMIIGLLIGGILRGQELLKMSRITASVQQFKAYEGATYTFQDQYQGLPGDIVNPSFRIPNCSAVPCNTPGNGNSIIGPVASITGFSYGTATENNAYFVQLAAAHLLSGIDSKSDWSSGAQAAAYPMTPLGALMWIAYYNHSPAAGGPWTSALQGHWFVYVGKNPSGAGFTHNAVAVNTLALIDKKLDDGLPWSGQAVLNSSGCNNPGQEYDMNNVTPCTYMVRSGF